MSDETVEVKAVVEEEKKAPGRKPGAMKRDEEGRLLKADGSLAKTIGRKPKKTAKEPKQEKKTGNRRNRVPPASKAALTKVLMSAHLLEVADGRSPLSPLPGAP